MDVLAGIDTVYGSASAVSKDLGDIVRFTHLSLLERDLVLTEETW